MTTTTTRETTRRTGASLLAAAVAVSAYGGAIGLVLGALGLPAELEARLPFGSPVLGGLALALVVALPSTVLARFAWRDDPRTDPMALVAGVLLVGWIVVELVFIRELSFFHPAYVLVGVVLLWLGRHGIHDVGSLLRPHGGGAPR